MASGWRTSCYGIHSTRLSELSQMHYAIYEEHIIDEMGNITDGHVIHYSGGGDGDGMKDEKNNAQVRRDPFKKVAGKSHYRINNSADFMGFLSFLTCHTNQTSLEILRRAKSRVNFIQLYF
uniref:Uncharacterized protein n=1 Tax=Acrobeloides nanus TaxID=290746 RepID=A0A914CX39_9BILA